MDKIDINLASDYNGKPIEIRTGSALGLLRDSKYENHSLTLDSLSPIIDQLQHDKDSFRPVITVNRRRRTISYLSDVRDPNAHIATGGIHINRDLLEWGIDIPGISTTPVKYNFTELLRLIKPRRAHFRDPDVYITMMAALKDFKNRRNIDTQVSNDQRGNKKVLIEQKVDQEFEESFTLELPLFEGDTETYSFVVDVFMDTTDAGTIFVLESVELGELIQKVSDRMIDETVTGLKAEFAIPIVFETSASGTSGLKPF